MAISASVVWEVQTTGSDSNGGGFKTGATGADRTYPISNPQAIADLKTDGATLTVMVSATYTFVASDVGNVVSVNVSDSGGLATVGRYEITSVASGKATVDREWASGNNGATAGATAVLGGALATPGQLGKTIQTASEGVAYQTAWVRSGTYTLTTDAKQSGGPCYISVAGIRVTGYGSTRGDYAAQPILHAGAQTNVLLWELGGTTNSGFFYLGADGNGGLDNEGFRASRLDHRLRFCSARNCLYGFRTTNQGQVVQCFAESCGTGFQAFSFVSQSSAKTCTVNGFASTYVTQCLASECSTGFTSFSLAICCTADSCEDYGYYSTGNFAQCVACLATNHNGVGAIGFRFPGNGVRLERCAGYNNATHVSGGQDVIDFVSLSADPYVDQANDDFRPNDTAGGGAALRAAGIGVYGQTNNTDIGAVQHTDPISGYTYGDENPGHVLTTAAGAGTYVPIADSDMVDGGVEYGAGEEGTGVNAAAIEAILDARGITTDNIALTNQPLTSVQTQSAAAAAIEAAGIATEDKQDEILAAIASAGVGARACVITVDDGSTALESARVRVTKGAESWLQTTDASGEATFNLDDGSWTVAITLAGYTFGGDTLVVNGDETETYSMTAAGFTSSVEPDSVTVRWRVMDEDGRPCGAGEGTVRIRVSVGPKVAGFAWDKSERIATTDANGYVEFPDVPVGCTLRAKLGAASAGGEWIDVAIPSDATSPYEPVEILGTVP